MRRRGFVIGAATLPLLTEGAALAQTRLYVSPEEAPHERTFMMWPVSRRVHPDPVFLRMLQRTIAKIANTIAAFEPVVMLVADQDKASAVRLLGQAVTLWNVPTEDLWARDAGPLFAWCGDELVVSHIQFNGWGEDQIHRRDGQVAQRVAEKLGVPVVPSGLVGEAGAVEHDGNGLMIAHESSWWWRRNSNLPSRDVLTQRLLAAYGADQMIWTPGVHGEDITDYHIDSLARFTGPARVLMNLPARPDWDDPFHRAAFVTRDVLKDRLEVDVIPETDAIAVEALERHYPGREIVTLNVDALGEVGGGIHCATMQQPAAV